MIRIYHNEIELSIVLETLTTIVRNSVFSDSFSLEYSKHPFLILENKETVEALGSRHILSLNKKKQYDVRVFKEEKVYFGKLKVLGYAKGVRKCDLVFGTEILKILDKQISSFMPTVYLGDEIPYAENASTKIPQQPIIDALAIHEKKSYPDVNFQFPEIYAPDLFDSDKESAWKDYSFFINKRDDTGKLSKNYEKVTSQINAVSVNESFLKPMLYLSSIFDFCFSEIGYKVFLPDFTFFKDILVFANKKNNNYIFKRNLPELDFKIDAKEKKITVPSNSLGAGKYKVKYNLRNIFTVGRPLLKDNFIYFGVHIMSPDNKNVGEVVGFFKELPSSPEIIHIEGEVEFEIKSGTYSLLIVFDNNTPITNGGWPITKNDVTISMIDNELQTHLIHSTIELSRHVPEWTVTQTINNVRNLLNLKVDVDDSLKEIRFSFVRDYLLDSEIVDLSSYKLELRDYRNNQSDIFKISYANDNFIRIDENGISKKSVTEKDAVIIDNEFITLPFNGTHHLLKKDDLDGGVVLLLNKDKTPNTIDRVNGQSLNLDGFAGIGETYWKDWVNFRKNSSGLSLVGEIFKHDLIRIDRIKKVYYNNIVFLVEEIVNKERNGRMETVLKVHSKVF